MIEEIKCIYSSEYHPRGNHYPMRSLDALYIAGKLMRLRAAPAIAELPERSALLSIARSKAETQLVLSKSQHVIATMPI